MRRRYDVMDIHADDEMSSAWEYGNKEKNKNDIHQIPTYIGVSFIVVLLAMIFVVHHIDNTLPAPMMLSDEKQHPNAFIAERAQKTLEGLTNLGPRVIGSPQNEKHAIDLLKNEINQIIKAAHKSQYLELDHQISSGSYFLGYKPVGLINVYNNVQNIIVKIHGSNSTSSILVNAHFDSVPSSPGASDDGIMCAVMMEILRKMSENTERPKNNIIFLFNGAEELILEASHGYITQHKWAKESKVLVNLDAGGHGHRELLFQTGPNVSWLLKYYTNAPYPTGHAAGEEIFQSNVIPSDTDYRIFRDFGNLIGYDFAFARNGYRYHTKYDRFEDLKLGTYQHAGSNILYLIRQLANAPEIENPHDHGKDNVVYYDVIGFFMITYSQTFAFVINITTVILSFGIAYLSLKDFFLSLNFSVLKYVVFTNINILASWVISIGVVFGISSLLLKTNNAMSWYGNQIIVVGLYSIPILITLLLFQLLLKHCRRQHKLSFNIQTQVNIHLTRLIWTAILLVGTLFKIRGVYLILISVGFETAAFIIIKITGQVYSRRTWKIIYVLFSIFPAAYVMYISLLLLGLFVPVTGRCGAEKNTELLIGFITYLLTITTVSHFVPFITLIKKPRVIIGFLFAIFIGTLIVAMTPLGFPYSGNSASPTPQRFMVYHTNRNHRNTKGEIVETKSGILSFNMDYNSPLYIKKYVPEFTKSVSIRADCDKYLVCGLPISNPRMVANVDVSSTWINFEKPLPIAMSSIELKSKTKVSDNITRFEFSAKGTNYVNIYMKSKPGTIIKTTSLSDTSSDELLFVHCISGTPNPVYNFTVDVLVPTGWVDAPLIDIAISGKYVYLDAQLTDNYKKFLQEFPSWADVISAVATYESYIF